ncbi:2-3-amino-3-carboxypropylhistidine synthase subunit 2 [Hondaea fermentalgiana]|uniref:2-(3-amino-3-carboxypropyl)histidine synthase subunit 2 n=1 Tax=Hondaea fermentalgiana TaxID=2315210 RepID=A0A2R5GB03_9STRA|nr:2-3-amino-3-carboxypropylhistidine synthase subunit 2 [Hondaea fermentalgiana]|eukprot:GBG27775.1 2-3-amino-3-carboxypropylhistidine synthase subunit 2 [Hondaea fermentalgiana]
MAIDDSGERAVTRELDAALDEAALDDATRLLAADSEAFDHELRVQESVDIVREHGFRRVALQIPDELFPIALRLAQTLRDRINDPEVHLFVLGDTSFGSCCVDEVAAEHNTADFVIHYGHSCLSRTSRLPVQLVFGDRPLAVDQVAAAIATALENNKGQDEATALPSRVVIIRDVRYEHAIPDLASALTNNHGLEAVVPVVNQGFRPVEAFAPKTAENEDLSQDEKKDVVAVALGQEVRESRDFVAIYLGANDDHFAQIALTLGIEPCKCLLACDPATGSCAPPTRRVTNLIAKRFLKVQQTRDAPMIGLLVGTMGVQGYATVIQSLSRLAQSAGKKTYTFLMGKINPQKLANFAHIDAYVLVACPLNSLLDSKDFFKPVVTPFELEVALNARSWSTRFELAFSNLASIQPSSTDQNAAQHEAENDDDADAPHFSLATGSFVRAAVAQPLPAHAAAPVATSAPDALVEHGNDRHITIRYASPAADALASQTFRGLDPAKGDKAPQAAQKGQSGTASGLHALDDPHKKV